jgi:hypothetical protein
VNLLNNVKNITYIIRSYASNVNEDRLRRHSSQAVTSPDSSAGNTEKRFLLTLGPFSFLISLLCKFFHPILLFTTFITLGACTQALIALNKAKAMGAKAHGFFSL